MNDIDELIQEISLKHGIALSRDDPVLILQTINARLLEDGVKAQSELLCQYKAMLEDLSLRWGNESKERAEKILNASLEASKGAMAKLLKEGAEITAVTIKQELDASVLNAIKEKIRMTGKIALINLTASALTILSVLVISLKIFSCSS